MNKNEETAYCENDDCRVVLYLLTEDNDGTKNENCPGCGQFGRLKG